MTYLDRPPPGKGPPWAHNNLGASVHNALAAWWRLPQLERTVPAAGQLLDSGWIEEGFASAVQSARYRSWARELVLAYVAGLDPADEPVGVERTVATRTDKIAVSGRIDRLDRRRPADPADSSLIVVDYKTGRHVPTMDDVRASLPLAIYAIAAERTMRRPCRRVELHHLPTGLVMAWDHTPDSLARQLRRAEDIAAECATADESFRAGPPGDLPGGGRDDAFPPRPSPWCCWCDYRAVCPEGSAASERRRPWDGLAPTEDPGPGEGPELAGGSGPAEDSGPVAGSGPADGSAASAD